MHKHLNLVQGISKQQLEDITTVGDEGAFALDNGGKLLFLNRQAEKMLGWKTAELLHEKFFTKTNFKPDTIASIGTMSCAALSSVGCSHLQKGATITAKDGRVLKVYFISIAIFDKGRVVGKVFVFAQNINKTDPTGVYAQLVNNCAGVLLKLDLQGSVIFANEYAQQRFGDKLDKIVPANVQLALQNNPEKLLLPTHSVNNCKDRQGGMLSIAWSINAVRDASSKVVGAMCVGADISDIEVRGSVLTPDKGLAQRVFQCMQEAVVSVDQQGLVAYLNPLAERLSGWSNDDARGLMLQDVLPIVDVESRQTMLPMPFCQDDSANATEKVSGILMRRDGQDFPVEGSLSAIADAHGRKAGTVIVFSNLLASNKNKPWELYNAKHDVLTGLIIRPEFELTLTQALASARNDGRQHALCVIDVASFAKLNELHNEQFGDEILNQISSLIKQNVSASDIVARIGDDEFGVIFYNCSLQAAKNSVSKICKCVGSFKFSANEIAIKVGVSVGLIPLTSGSGGLADVLRMVDAACFVAKGKGRDRVHVYNLQDSSLQECQGELVWIHKIRQSLRRNQFRLYTQVIVPMKKRAGSVPHYEVLLRMLDDAGDLIRPGAFLPTAVRFGLMPSIDRWVVKEVLSMLDKRINKSEPVGIYAINLSAQSLDDDNFLGFVIDQLDKCQFPTENICFEITESSALSNLMSATRFMSIVRGMGCRFSLDDFGKGFSSYAYLKNLPLDYLKIDGSFIRELSNDPINLAMVRSINQIGHVMGVQTIAECVENEDTFEKLASIEVDYVQGYKAGKPLAMQQNISLVRYKESVD